MKSLIVAIKTLSSWIKESTNLKNIQKYFVQCSLLLPLLFLKVFGKNCLWKLRKIKYFKLWIIILMNNKFDRWKVEIISIKKYKIKLVEKNMRTTIIKKCRIYCKLQP